MQYRPLRGIIGLTAIGAATAVGITTHSAGFTALTFVGTLLVPRVLGFGGGHRWRGGACAGRGDQVREHLETKLETWHSRAHGAGGDAAATPSTPLPA